MADELTTKRIINLPAESAPAAGDVFVVDNETTGTKKLPVTSLIDPTPTAGSGKAVSSGGAYDGIADLKNDFTEVSDALKVNSRVVGFGYGYTSPSTGQIVETSQWITVDKMYQLPYNSVLSCPSDMRMTVIYFDDQAVITSSTTNQNLMVIPANQRFKVSFGKADHTDISATEIGSLMRKVTLYSEDRSASFDFTENNTQANMSTVFGGSFHPVMESGTIETDGTLNRHTGRCRTYHGMTYHVYKGDTISISDTDYELFVRVTLRNGTYFSSNWVQSYIVPTEGDAYIICRLTSTGRMAIENIPQIAESITITTSGGIISGKDTDKDYARYGAYVNGVYSETKKRICNSMILHYEYPVSVEIASGYELHISFYEADGTYIDKIYTKSRYTIPANSYWTWYFLLLDSSAEFSIQVFADLDNILTIKKPLPKAVNQALNWSTLGIFPKIGVLGDSFASGSLHHPDDSEWTGNYALSWPQIMGRSIGSEVTNFSKGGLSTRTWLTDQNYGLPALQAETPKNLYIIALGINDNTAIENGTMQMGTIADCLADYTQNPDTFYGNYGRILGSIAAHAPKAKVVLLSVARFSGRARMDEPIREIAEHFNLPFIYLPDDPFFVSRYYYDGMFSNHPLSYTYGGMAEAIKRLIIWDMTVNPDYYSTYYGET